MEDETVSVGVALPQFLGPALLLSCGTLVYMFPRASLTLVRSAPPRSQIPLPSLRGHAALPAPAPHGDLPFECKPF